MTTFEERLTELLSGTYDIERELGGGGMSRVFVATDRALGRKVVIKLLSPELTAEVNRGRFRREIQVAAQLQHPHIVTLLSAGEDGELVYYTMPFIEGESLKSALEKTGRLSVRDVVRVLYDVVDALSYAHARGVVHRDIKPANILRSGNHSLVTDFGVAKALNAAMPSTAMTSTGMAIGTPAYMAPEQLAGDPAADHRIDIYAVGLLAYELLTGKSPFASTSPQAVLAAVLTRDPAPVSDVREDVPRRLSEMIMQCLSKVPGGRPPSAEALLVALDLFSTASGEIRTREYKVPEIEPTMPVHVMNAAALGAVAVAGSDATPAAVTAPSAVTAPPVITEPTAAIAPGTGPTVVPVPVPITDPAISVPTQPVEVLARSNRNKYLVGALAVLLLTAAGAFALSKRGGQKTSASTDQPSSTSVTPPAATDARTASTNVPAPAAVAPIVIDSAAIAAAVQKRMAEAAAKAPAGKAAATPLNTDSLRRALQKHLSDSIARVNAARAAAAAAVVAVAPAPAPAPAPATAPAPAPVPPPASTGPRRLAITEPRQNRDQPVFNRFTRQFIDALRASIDNSGGFSLIDQSEVSDAIGRTSSRDEAAKILKPDVMVSPSYVGSGDTVNIVVMVWDLRSSSSFGIRVTSTKLVPSNPEHYLGPVIQSVMKQLDDLSRAPTIYRRQ